MKRSITGLVLLVVVAAIVPAPAAPSAPGRARYVLRSFMAFPRSLYPSGRKVLETRALAMHAGERRLVHGRLTAHSRARVVQEQQAQLGCAERGQVPVRMMRTSRNHTGPVSARGSGILTLDVQYLFVAPADGTYACSLFARGSGETIRAIPGKTYLSISRADERLAQQWSGDPCDSRGTRADPEAGKIDSWCRYLVPGGRGGFPGSGTALASTRFVADPLAKVVEVRADVQLTTCYQGTKSCVREVSRYGGWSPHSSAVIASRLEATQLDVAGEPCALSAHPGRRSLRTTIIAARAHHQKISHRLIHRVSDAPGCTRRFAIRVVLRAIRGDPVKFTDVTRTDARRGAGMLDGLPGPALSNAIARNLF